MFNKDISRPVAKAREEQSPCVVLGGERSRAGAWGLMMSPCQSYGNQPRRDISCACTLIWLEMGGVASLSH